MNDEEAKAMLLDMTREAAKRAFEAALAKLGGKVPNTNEGRHLLAEEMSKQLVRLGMPTPPVGALIATFQLPERSVGYEAKQTSGDRRQGG